MKSEQQKTEIATKHIALVFRSNTVAFQTRTHNIN